MTKEEIDKLLKRRESCRTRINQIKDKPGYTEKALKTVEEFQNITKILNENGKCFKITQPQFFPEYYTKRVEPKKEIPVPEVEVPKPEVLDQKYTLSLAWTESPAHDVSTIINKVKEYFDDMDMEELECERVNKGNEVEYIVKYAFEGDERSFKILKYSAQFLLDTISDTDYAKFNIAIFGKKKVEDVVEPSIINDPLEDRVKKLEDQVSTLIRVVKQMKNEHI